MRLLLISAVILLLGTIRSAHAEGNDIWIEGENPASTDIKPNPWYSSVDKSQLSGSEFLANFSSEEGHAHYQFSAPKEGSYTFWIRANPIGDPKLDYQLNAADGVPIDFSNQSDLVNIASDSKPDLRFLAWIKVGQVQLKAGANTIDFKFHSANNNHGSIDCFVFAQNAFRPHGAVKPGQKLGTDEPGWWSFEPQPETFADNAELDLRYLNEKVAGESGFLQADGDSFKLGNGQAVRFWAVNCVVPDHLSKEEMDFSAARFAKLGINLVRLHGNMFDREGTDPTKINSARLDGIFYFVSALKKQGIYVDLSTFFVLGFQIKANDGIPGTDDVVGKISFGLLFFEPRMQEIYKSWIKQVLTTPNPYTGKTLAQEPSIGLFEIQNEDSLFFWTFNPAAVGRGPLQVLETKFGTWLAAKYGSVDRALSAWSGEKLPDDSATEGHAGLYGAYEMSTAAIPQQSAARQSRVLDQIHFLADLQRGFYDGIHRYLREDLGAKWPIVASNWTTASGLGFIERYTYAGCEVIDKHGYFAGRHEGEASGYSVRNGQTYEDRTALMNPASVPFQYVRLPGHPHIQSEIAWNKPNRFVAEGDLLVSAYESLQGVDGVIFFVAPNGEWENSGAGMWPFMMPGEAGQSPADALQYRRFDLKPGETVIRQVTTVDDVLARKSSNLIEGENGDFRIAGKTDPASAGDASSFDPLAFFVGRVERSLKAGDQPIAVDLHPYIDREKQVITSSTGELKWDYGQGLFTANSPNSQAITGFLAKAGAITLGDVTIRSGNEYGTIHVISLDGQPIAKSKKILIQAFTEEKMTGFKASNGVIQQIGREPIIVRDIDAQVTFAHSPGLKAQRLDEQGYRGDDLAIKMDGDDATVPLPRDSLYTIVTRP